MAIMRYRDWDPFQEMAKFLDRYPSKLPKAVEDFRFPAVDVQDKDSSVLITAEIPGIKPENLELELHDNQLMIRGEKKEKKGEKDESGRYYYKERSFGSFFRTIPLTQEVDPDKVDANYKDGLLKVEIAKSEAKKAKKIKVK